MADEASDYQLLQTHRATGSQEAFARLVSRHFSWVISSARRQVRDSAMADDVTQAVFIVLAKKPPTISPDSTLSPWLFGVVRRTCLNALRAQKRRRHYEQKAATMTSEVIESGDESSAWADLAPHLDGLLQTLNSADRQVLLLRFFERKSLADVGRSMGISEEASRKRVDRAIEKLRAAASKRNLQLAPAGAIAALLLANVARPASAQIVTAATSNVLAALSPSAAPTGGSILAQSVLKSLFWSSIKIPLVVSSLIALAMIGLTAGGWMRQSTPIASEQTGPTQTSAFHSPTTAAENGKLRVGYLVSKFTVTGPGKAFNGGGYTHAHPKVVPALADPSIEMWAVLEPGSEEDPSIAQIVQDVFGGRQLNGADVSQLQKCDVIVAAGVRNATPEVLRTLEYVVNEGTGLMIWICIGVTSPGVSDPVMQKLNGLKSSPDHGGQFALEWMDARVVGTHEILGNLSGRIGTPVKFRPELVWGLDPSVTPLVQMVSGPNEPPYYPVYVSTLGKGRIVHFGFATYTQIPKDFDKMVGGHFALRCMNWLAHRPMPPTVATTLPATQPVTTRDGSWVPVVGHAAPTTARIEIHKND
ncbi:MAG TPA: sigma-70 family RNA polymerase sigma factor [Tepidisphaeraceae bacterium]|jgi:RNA polymerase sigma factor (sigma-70 family)|nr:sigma-70 family RNA polymerase sigma factor [Tepidisphaeraceae bacterium]